MMYLIPGRPAIERAYRRIAAGDPATSIARLG
jgi:hypothetical protein